MVQYNLLSFNSMSFDSGLLKSTVNDKFTLSVIQFCTRLAFTPDTLLHGRQMQYLSCDGTARYSLTQYSVVTDMHFYRQLLRQVAFTRDDAKHFSFVFLMVFMLRGDS